MAAGGCPPAPRPGGGRAAALSPPHRGAGDSAEWGRRRRLRSRCSELAEIEQLAASPEDTTRHLVTRIALAVQAALLVQHAPTAVADAFVGSRLGTGWGPGFGTLRGVDVQAVIDHGRSA